MTAYKLRTRDFLADVDKVPRMLAKGKLSLLPNRSGDAKEVRQVHVDERMKQVEEEFEMVVQASAAAGRAMTLLAAARGTRVRTKAYPPERDISDEPPRIGVFICHCGNNIASVVSKKKMPVGGQTAWIDHDKCIFCMTCVHVCPYMAPRINKFNKAEVRSVSCMGCGSCTAECPARAITLRHFADAQIIGAVDNLLANKIKLKPSEEEQERSARMAYLDDVGVAQSRWPK